MVLRVDSQPFKCVYMTYIHMHIRVHVVHCVPSSPFDCMYATSSGRARGTIPASIQPVLKRKDIEK